ncbi:superoxide dismutase [Mn], mitochondrial-like [Convolutriloba macropyga]|uniref:superoxide dismutase [Mn], mitochondrial-like n=1 Tax=Convolutriloba macropyga TaxID=536237 RepID=UPI003F51CBDD
MFLTKLARGNLLNVGRFSGFGLITNLRDGFSIQSRTKATLPDLQYDYNALEPYICTEIMQLHHGKHHLNYVNTYNAVEQQLADAIGEGDTSKAISLQRSFTLNGGAHLNHSIFWQNLSPNGGGEPSGTLADMIKSAFGSFDVFVEEMCSKTIAIHGSGWGWLGFNKDKNRLELATCANQDPLLATTGLHPLLGIDIWEHAFYVQYKARPEYLNAIFNVINWKDVERRLSEAMQ